MDEEFKRNSLLFLELHPLPTVKDRPTDVLVNDWEQLLTTVDGVNRTQEFNL